MTEAIRDGSYVVSCILDSRSDYSTDSAIADKLLSFFARLNSLTGEWVDAGWCAKTRGEDRLYVDTESADGFVAVAARALVPDPLSDPNFSSPAEYGRTIQLRATGRHEVDFQLVAGNSLDGLWIANVQRSGMGISTHGDDVMDHEGIEKALGQRFLRAAALSLDLSFGTLIEESILDRKREQGIYLPVGDEMFISSELMDDYPKSGESNPAISMPLGRGLLISEPSSAERRAVEEWLGGAIG